MASPYFLQVEAEYAAATLEAFLPSTNQLRTYSNIVGDNYYDNCMKLNQAHKSKKPNVIRAELITFVAKLECLTRLVDDDGNPAFEGIVAYDKKHWKEVNSLIEDLKVIVDLSDNDAGGHMRFEEGDIYVREVFQRKRSIKSVKIIYDSGNKYLFIKLLPDLLLSSDISVLPQKVSFHV